MANWKDLSPAEQVTHGVVPPGPLAPMVQSKNPEENAQAIREHVNPSGQEILAKGILGTGMGSQTSLIGEDPFNPKAKEILPGVAAMGAGLAIPMSRPVLGPLLRTGAAGLAAGGTSKLLGGEFTMPAITGAGTQLLGEGVGAGIRQGINQKKGPLMLQQRAEQEKFNNAMAEGITGAEQKAYKEKVAAQELGYKDALKAAKAEQERAKAQVEGVNKQRMAEYSEKGAGQIAEEFKKAVPSWSDIPSDTKGLLDMVYGKGQEKLSASFDKSLKESIGEAKGKIINMAPEDAVNLGLIRPQAVEQTGNKYPIPIDAADIIPKITGKWKTDPGLYRRVFKELDKAGVGNEQARSEYKAGQALIQFADKTGMLRGETFNPDKAMAGFTQLKQLEEIRRRGQGNIFEGPISEAVRAPRPTMEQVPPMRDVPRPDPGQPPLPTFPPKLPDMPVKAHPLGTWQRRIEGAAVGEGLGQLFGHPGVGGMMGAALGPLAIPNTLYTGVPLGPLAKQATTRGPSVIAEGIRLLLDRANSEENQ